MTEWTEWSVAVGGFISQQDGPTQEALLRRGGENETGGFQKTASTTTVTLGCDTQGGCCGRCNKRKGAGIVSSSSRGQGTPK